MSGKEIISCSAYKTEEIAKNLAKNLKGGEILALTGDLGTGKTTFVKGIAKGLGIKQNITSPTFVLMRQYAAGSIAIRSIRGKKHIIPVIPLILIHIDCYRLKSIEDVLSLGITDYLGKKDTVCLIEWADKIKNILPKDTIQIKFEHIIQNKRKIIILPHS